MQVTSILDHRWSTCSVPATCDQINNQCWCRWIIKICQLWIHIHIDMSTCSVKQVSILIKRLDTLSWPPTSQTVKLIFLYSTVSTLNPANNNLSHNNAKLLITKHIIWTSWNYSHGRPTSCKSSILRFHITITLF